MEQGLRAYPAPAQTVGHQGPALGSQVIEQILPLSPVVQYQKDEEVPIKETDSRRIYYVQKGAVEVYHTFKETKIVVAMIGEGDFFGEIAYFDGVSRVRNIRATSDCIIRIFEEEMLERVQEENPRLYGKFLTYMTRRICAKFRMILEEREPLTAYAASLSTGKRGYQGSRPLPEAFLQTREWRSVSRIVEDMKAQLFDLSHRLQQDASPEISEVAQAKCHALLDDLNEQLEKSVEVLTRPEVEDNVWGYFFKELFPYFMRSRFAERAYFKPKGYAGDYLMMEMIYRNQPEGDGKLGVILDRWYLDTSAARAVRGRRELLGSSLREICGERMSSPGPIRIMNLACGSNRELFDFLSECKYTEKIEAICVDADLDALQYTNQHVNVFHHGALIRLMNDNVVKWSLGRVRHDFGMFDIVYSAGLTDYLDRRLFKALVTRCFEHLKPGGILIIGNFGPNNPNRVFMDRILQWKLIHRHESELRQLFEETPFGERCEIIQEKNGVNLFAKATRE
ncbi:MAG: cyclic nucleotide-binding domain-containing protein [Syntrophobacteraceae bacterium]|jgi:CRP-like cAMP-binding protein/SAM-dependent methyltransferase|nr:cyclic nucleotide-binding domain-containing protein [Syntrophobacteraceae bacterium]